MRISNAGRQKQEQFEWPTSRVGAQKADVRHFAAVPGVRPPPKKQNAKRILEMHFNSSIIDGKNNCPCNCRR